MSDQAVAEKDQDSYPVLDDDILDIKKYVDKVNKSDEYEARRRKMNKYMDLYEGKLYDDAIYDEESDSNESAIQINYIFSTVETLCPLLTDNRPAWYIRARHPIFQNMANLFRLGLDFVWDYTDMGDRAIPDVVKYMLLFPVGLTKTTYDPDDKEIAIQAIDPRTFVIAPGYADERKAPWMGEITQRPLSWIADNFPDKLSHVRSEGGMPDMERDNSEKSLFQKFHENVTVYDLWIKDPTIEDYMRDVKNEDGTTEKKPGKRKKYAKGRHLVFTNNLVLTDEESPFTHGKPPYTAYYDYRRPNDFWGMGEPDQIEYLHKELNRQLQAIVKHSTLAHDPNFTIDENAFEDTEKIKKTFWKGGNLYTCNYLNNAGTPIRKVDPGFADQSILTLLTILPNAIEEVSQVGELMKGQAPKKERQSASEISVMIESSYTRVRQKVRNLESSLRRNAELIVELEQQFYKTERYVSVRKSDKEGPFLDYAMVGSNKDVLKASNTPDRPPDMKDEEYVEKKKADMTWQATEEFCAELGDTDSVYWSFMIEIQTNSTLPMDKQTLANLYLRLAQIQITEKSIVDAEAILNALGVPDKDAIIARQKQREQAMMKAMATRQNLEQGKGRMPGPQRPPMGLDKQAPGTEQGGAVA